MRHETKSGVVFTAGEGAGKAVSAAVLALVAGSAGGLMPGVALAGPAGEQVAAGTATFARNGAVTQITASHNAIINYSSFDIARGETVQFVQPSAAARVLNRIQGEAPTRIDGSLLGNGKVYVVNPSGVMFGSSAIVNVGGLYAAAGSMSDADFLSGTDHFTGVSGRIGNEGMIDAGSVALVARTIENAGSITADGGVVAAMIGSDVYIREANGRIYARIDGRDVDAGSPPASGRAGRVAKAQDPAGIRNTGAISATGGVVSLGAGDFVGLAIHNAGVIAAHGGSVEVTSAGGTIRNDGTIDVSVGAGTAGQVAIRGPIVSNNGRVWADAESGSAGTIALESSRGTVIGRGGVVSAQGLSGNASGGDVLIDSTLGDTYISKGAVVDISGGATGGDGGSLEVSAAKRLGLYGEIRGGAASGYDAGSVLIDPENIIINATGKDDGQLSDGEVLGGDGGGLFTISAGAIEGFAGDVRLEATLDIGIWSNINKTNGGLTLWAGRDILFLGQPGGGPDTSGLSTKFRSRGVGCGKNQELSILATDLDFFAGRDIVDFSTPRGTRLTASAGDIRLTAQAGLMEFGMLDVSAGRTVFLTQASDMFVGSGRFGFIKDPANTCLVVNITDGYLTFGGDFGGIRGEQSLLCLDATASEGIAINDHLTIGQDARFNAGGDIWVAGDIHAGGLVELHAGTDGTGNLQWTEPCLDVWGSEIILAAGNGSGTTARVDARGCNPIFRGPGGGKSRPGAFTYRQDAPITDADLPRTTQFGAPVSGMRYTIDSTGSTVTLTNGKLVEGAILTLSSVGGSFICGPLSLTSLDVFGTATLGANVTSTQHQHFRGAVTVVGDRTLTGTTITFDGPVDGRSDGKGGISGSLAIVGDLEAGGPIGATTPLNSLSVSGTSLICGGLVRTVGIQSYAGDVTLCADTTMESTSGGDIIFGGLVDGTPGGDAESLTILGGLVAGGAIGGRDPLEFLSVSGRSLLNGGLVATLGDQAFGGPVILGADTSLRTGTRVVFGGAVDSDSEATPRVLEILGGMTALGPIGGNGAIQSLSVEGPIELCGGLVRTVEGQTYAGDMTLCVDTTLESTSGADITFGGRVDGTPGGEGEALTIRGGLVARGAIGGLDPLEALRVTGRSLLQGGLVATLGDQDFGGPVVLGADTRFATGTTVRFAGTLDSDSELSPRLVEIFGGLIAEGVIGGASPLAELSVSGTSELCGGLVRTVGAQSYAGDVRLCADTTLDSLSGGAIAFRGRVDGTAGGDDEFLMVLGSLQAYGEIGGLEALESLGVSGTSFLGGSLVRTIGDQSYAGNVTLGGPTTLATAGGRVSLGGSLDMGDEASGSLAILGDLVAGGPIGAAGGLESLLVAGTSQLCGGLVRTTNDQTYSGAVVLCDDTVLESTSGGMIAFGSSVDAMEGGGEESLTILGSMLAQGPMGATTALEFLEVAGDSTFAGGLVRTLGDQRFGGVATLNSDMIFRSLGAGTIRFGGGIQAGERPCVETHDEALLGEGYGSPGDCVPEPVVPNLLVETGPGGTIRFGGSVGSADRRLASITLCTLGEVGLLVPEVATIIGEQSIALYGEEFLVCRGEKFTTLGDLRIDMTNRAVLSDLVSVGDLFVSAPAIELRLRSASTLREFTGGTTSDRGLDWVAGGRMVVEGAVGVDGDGPFPTFSSGDGVAPAALGAWEFTKTPAGRASLAQLVRDGIVLDQKTFPATTPDDNDPLPDLAGATSSLEPIPFADRVQPRAFDLRAMARIAVTSRGVDPREAVSSLVGKYVYNDLPKTPGGYEAGERAFAATRVDLDAVMQVVDRYNALFGLPGRDRGPQIGAAIAEASERAGASGDGKALRDYLERTPGEKDTLAYVRQLESMLDELRRLGLPVMEFEAARERILADLSVPGRISTQQLREMVGGRI